MKKRKNRTNAVKNKAKTGQIQPPRRKKGGKTGKILKAVWGVGLGGAVLGGLVGGLVGGLGV